MSVEYAIGTASLGQIHSLLRACDDSFLPALSSRVNLYDYSTKLFRNSLSFEAWNDETLVGMINAYLNDAGGLTAFITNVCILNDYANKGIAFSLLQMCIGYAQELGFNRIRLEVSQRNTAAHRLYLKAGFEIVAEQGENLLMEYCILQ